MNDSSAAKQPDDELVKEVFAHFGLAVYLAQVLEHSLLNALTTAYGPGPNKLTQAELEKRFENLNARTLSALLSTLRDAGLPADLMPTVRAALEDRNRLAHEFFWAHALDFTSAEGCRRLLAELLEMQQRMSDCTGRVEAEVHRWAAAHGIRTDDFDAIHAAMLDRGHVLSGTEVEEVIGPRSGAQA